MVTMTHDQHTAPAPATPHGSHAPAGIPDARAVVGTIDLAVGGMPAGACEPCGVAGAGAVCWSCVMVTILVVRKGGMRVCARSDQRARRGDRVAGPFDGGLDVLVGARLGCADRHLRGAAVHQLDLDVR